MERYDDMICRKMYINMMIPCFSMDCFGTRFNTFHMNMYILEKIHTYYIIILSSDPGARDDTI